MKIMGHTLDGDLIIQVSQSEWDGLQDGVRPKDEPPWERWSKTEAYKFLGKVPYITHFLWGAFYNGNIDGSIQSLQDVASGKIGVRGISPIKQAKLKELLNEQPNA